MAEPKKFNFRSESDAKLALSPDSIPTLVPSDALALFQGGDSAPYYKLQAIDYPTTANGWTYTEDFWKSYIAKLNRAPIPGSARGHTTAWGARGPTDLLVVGGRVDSKGDGSGTVYLKNYIPPKGESGDNGVFIAMNKAGMVDYSIVSYTRDEVASLPDGSMDRKCVESLSGERNDAVDYGTGAMDMKTNADTLAAAIESAKVLIGAGKVERNATWSPGVGDLELAPGYPYGKAGMVFRSALRSSAARAAHDHLPDVGQAASDLLKSIDAKSAVHRGGNCMEKDEVLGALATMKANAQITLSEVAKAMGLEGQLRTETDAQAALKLNAIMAELGEGDPVAQVKAMKAQIEQGANAARENAIVALVGGKKNADGTDNVRYNYLASKTGGLAGEKLSAALAEIKTDPVMLALSAQAADVGSGVNIVAPKGNAAQDGDSKFSSGAAVEL
jgi:hypothetical protein